VDKEIVFFRMTEHGIHITLFKSSTWHSVEIIFSGTGLWSE